MQEVRKKTKLLKLENTDILETMRREREGELSACDTEEGDEDLASDSNYLKPTMKPTTM